MRALDGFKLWQHHLLQKALAGVAWRGPPLANQGHELIAGALDRRLSIEGMGVPEQETAGYAQHMACLVNRLLPIAHQVQHVHEDGRVEALVGEGEGWGASACASLTCALDLRKQPIMVSERSALVT